MDNRPLHADDLMSALLRVVDQFESVSGENVRESELPGEFVEDPNGVLSVDPDGMYRFEVRDRGHVAAQTVSRDLNEVLFAVVNGIVSNHAVEAIARRPDYDSIDDTRRFWFPLWSRWMHQLSEDWGVRVDDEIRSILETDPFE